MSIGKTILNVRKEKGMSQEEFGELFHVTRQTVSNWENDGKYYKHKQSIIDFFTGAGTGLVISCCISPDSIRRTVILCIGIAMFLIGGVKKLRWDKEVVKYLEKQEKEQ